LILIAKQFIALPLLDHLLIVTVLAFNLVAPRMGMWTYTLFAMPGTASHELCHWLVSFILGAKPTFPSLIPKRAGDAWRLGSVQAAPNFITTIPIALAPFLLLPIGLWYAVAIMSNGAGWWHMIHAWIAGTILIASLPSRQDWSVAMPAIVCVLAVTFWLAIR
jgi:hypothetical protein